MKSLIYALFFCLFYGCASPRMWIVQSDTNGGVIAYSGYSKQDSETFLKDIKSKVQCPDAFVLQEWKRESITTQESMIVPVENRSQTTTNQNYSINNSYNENLLNINGKEITNTKSTSYEVVPYTSKESWIEQTYICDWNKQRNNEYQALSLEEKFIFQKKECNGGNSYSCRVVFQVYVEKNDLGSAKLIAEKLCSLDDPRFGPGMCTYLAGLSQAEKNYVSYKNYLKKGCEIVKKSTDKIADDGEKSCTFYGAVIKDETSFNIGLPVLLNRCSNNKIECYDLACAYSIFGKNSKSIEYLKISLDAGFENWSQIDQDPDLKNVRNSDEYKKLILKYKNRSTVSSTGN